MKSKKVIIGIALVIIVVVVAILGIKMLSKNDDSANGKLGEKVWLGANDTYKFKDGDNKVTLTINSDLNFDKSASDYEYVVPYVLDVNGTQYHGDYTFYVGYSINSEDNDIPYSVQFYDFENGSIQLSVENK